MSKTSNFINNSLTEDLDHILCHTNGLWEDLRGKRLFITGGTGFFGRWFLESLIWANEKLNLKASALVLTRNYEFFKKQAPHLALNPAIKFHIGDIINFDFPKGKFSHIIHAAGPSARAAFNNEDPVLRFDNIVGGTKHILDFAVRCGAKKLLFISSGAVYGKQPIKMVKISEDYYGALDSMDSKAVMGISKQAAESLCALYAKKYSIEIKIARCFSFLGPYLQLDIHYAIGNFIQDRLKNKPIIMKGDGSPYRSYLYASDLMIWLWTILLRGKNCRPYNVGSEIAISIRNLAKLVARISKPQLEVKIMQTITKDKLRERYVPSTKRARQELNLKQTVFLKDSIKRAIKWNSLIL